MKHKLMLLLLFLSMGFCVKAQKITYSYDNAGNRIERRVVTLRKAAAFVASTSQMAGGGIDLKEVFSENRGDRKITIYPNPTRGKLALEVVGVSYDSKLSAKLFNIKGALLQQFKVAANGRTAVDMQALTPGTYLLVLFIDKEKLTYKIIKQ